MDFDIYELKVVLSTNIKTKKEVILTKDLIHNTEEGFSISADLNTYPFFTYDVYYSRRRLIRLTYQERINFFFNKERFKELLSSYNSPGTGEEERNAIVENNVMVMLELLLPTKYPAVKDLKQSFKVVFNKDGFTDHLYEPFIYNHPFSYLKIDGKTYTVKRVVWLNDMLNHPIYRKLIDEYRKFWVWCNEEKNNAKVVINKTQGELLEEINSCIDTIISLINNYVRNNPGITYSLASNAENSYSTVILSLITLYKISSLLYRLTGSDSPELKLADAVMSIQLKGLIKKADDELNEKLIDNEESAEFITKMARELINSLGVGIDVTRFLYLKQDKKNPSIDLNAKKNSTQELRIEIKKIATLYAKIKTTALEKDMDKYTRITNMFELPYDKVKQKYDDDKVAVPPVYRNFFYTFLTQDYRRPYRETTNALLQDLIDCKTEAKVKEFFAFMAKVYDFFLKNNDRSRLTKTEQKLLKVDMNYININQSTGVKREIHVMVDFIEGEITEANAPEIHCPFFGEHLGNEFEYLFRMFYYGTKPQDWDVKRNRMMFSLEKMAMEKAAEMGNKAMEVVGKPFAEEKGKEDIGKKVGANDNVKLDAYFLDQIVNRDNEKNEKDPNIKERLEALNKISRGELIYETTLLEVLKKKNPELYSAIKKWSEKEFDKTESLIQQFIALKSKYMGAISQLDYELQKYSIGFDEEGKYKREYDKLLNGLYVRIADRLFKSESQKNWAVTQQGGLNITKKFLKQESLRTSRRKK